MPMYNVEITETLTKVVPVEAESAKDAERIVELLYSNSEIILDYSDFLDWEITVLPSVDDND